MATIEQLSSALVKADAAGNTDDARALAAEIRKMRAPPPMNVDPTEGMSTVEKFKAGMGQGAAKLVRAVGQNFNLVSDDEIKEANRLDKALTDTKAGKAGSITGTVAALAPAMLIPGVNTYAGAAALGTGTGFLTTEGDLGDRVKGAAFGAAGGVGGKYLGDKVGAAITNKIASRQANAAIQQSQNASKDATLAAGRQAGYVVPPSQVEGSNALARLAEGLGGKIKTEQAASIANQKVTDSLARKGVGLAEDAPITRQALKQIRDDAFTAGYEPVRNAGQLATDAKFLTKLDDLAQQFGGASKSFPGAAKNDVAQALDGLKVKNFDAGDAVDMIRLMRESADGSFRAGNNALGKAQKGAADALEEQIERGLQASGKNGQAMLEAFKDARQSMAKTYSVEKALNDSTGSVAAGKLAQQLKKGKPLSGDLRTAAEFSQAFPKATQADRSLAPYSLFDLGAAGIGGTVNPLLTAAVAARPLARSAILSKGVQSAAVNPSYGGGNRLMQLMDSSANSTAGNMLLRTTPLALVPANQ